jgi:hypothetical protein
LDGAGRGELAENKAQRMAWAELVVAVGAHDQCTGRQPTGDESRHVERCLVGPVEVLEDDDRGLARAELPEHSSRHVVRAGIAGEQPSELSVDIFGDIQQRAEWARCEEGVAGSPQHTRRGALLGRERLCERGLADARFPADEDQPAAVARAGGLQRVAQSRERIGPLKQRLWRGGAPHYGRS